MTEDNKDDKHHEIEKVSLPERKFPDFAEPVDAMSDDAPDIEDMDNVEPAANVARAIQYEISRATSYGTFPLIAFGLDKGRRPEQAILITSTIPEMALAWDLLDRFLPEDYEFSGYVPWIRLESFAKSHKTVTRWHVIDIPGFCAERDAGLFTSVAQANSASKWRRKAFGLVDICGFSKATIEQQLSYRTSLALALSQACSRVNKLTARNYLGGRTTFYSTSTGDGFYFWHQYAGAANDISVFMLLIYTLVQSEAMRSDRSSMRLRGAFGVGEAYVFPSRQLQGYDRRPPVQDAIGPVLNGLARLLTAAKPGQFLVSDFERSGRTEGEVLNPAKLIEIAERELLPSELSPTDHIKPQHISLKFAPPERLRVSDKHGDLHYCYNAVGSLPNRFRPVDDVEVHRIGVPPDSAKDLEELKFSDE